jgi:hypothetical protein
VDLLTITVYTLLSSLFSYCSALDIVNDILSAWFELTATSYFDVLFPSVIALSVLQFAVSFYSFGILKKT